MNEILEQLEELEARNQTYEQEWQEFISKRTTLIERLYEQQERSRTQ